MYEDTAKNIGLIRQVIDEAATASGRAPNDILLLAATKTVPCEVVRSAIACGVKACGENRVQELIEKNAQGAYDGAAIHFIGHLQTNKVRSVVGVCTLIHSVDSLHLAQAVDLCAKQLELVQDVLIEVNIGMEQSKSGVFPDAVEALLHETDKLTHLRVRGLMCVPPADGGTEHLHNMKRLFDEVKSLPLKNASMDYLSMGMSNDYSDAVLAGANIVRIGSAIFGKRVYTYFD